MIIALEAAFQEDPFLVLLLVVAFLVGAFLGAAYQVEAFLYPSLAYQEEAFQEVAFPLVGHHVHLVLVHLGQGVLKEAHQVVQTFFDQVVPNQGVQSQVHHIVLVQNLLLPL